MRAVRSWMFGLPLVAAVSGEPGRRPHWEPPLVWLRLRGPWPSSGWVGFRANPG